MTNSVFLKATNIVDLAAKFFKRENNKEELENILKYEDSQRKKFLELLASHLH